jgi:hypothetical protein
MSNSWRCFTTKWDTECIFLFVSFVYVLREPIQRKITDIMLLNIMFHSRWLLDDFLASAWGHVMANDQKTRKTAKDAQRPPQTPQELQRAWEIPGEPTHPQRRLEIPSRIPVPQRQPIMRPKFAPHNGTRRYDPERSSSPRKENYLQYF